MWSLQQFILVAAWKIKSKTAYMEKASQHLVDNYSLGDSSPQLWPRGPMRYPKRYEGKGNIIVQSFLALSLLKSLAFKPPFSPCRKIILRSIIKCIGACEINRQ